MDPLTLSPTAAFTSVTGPGDSLRRPAPALSSRQVSFSELLGRHSGSGDSGLTAEQRATAASEQLVSVALVQPLLAQLRATSHAAPPFAPTNGEKQMRALQDAEVARQITHAARFPLVERLARRMLDAASDAGSPASKAE